MSQLSISLSSSGRLLKTLTGVLAPVSLSSVATTSGSNVVTVASTTGVYPGMAIRAANVPPGSVVHAVVSSTQLELWASAWNASTGVFSHSAANAQATATASGGTGMALAFDPLALVARAYIDGMWRNTHRLTNGLMSYVVGPTLVPGISLGSGGFIDPTTVSVSTGLAQMTAGTARLTDELAATPVKRHDGVLHTSLLVVHTGGALSVIHEPHLKDITYAGADA